MSNTNMYGNWWETEIAQQILSKKYFHEGEDFADFVDRVRGIFSEELQSPIGQSLVNADFLPAGRSLYGAGAKGKFKSTMSNCYIMDSPKDNIEDIFEVAKKTARIFSMGGGAGINISKLRPRDAKVNNAAKTSTGAVSFLNIFNSIGEVIGANNRRAALMLGLECTHPDIEEFLTVKQNDTAIQSANLSILFTDKFMTCVEQKKDFELRFKVESTGEVISKTINAYEFFRKFCEAQWDFAEPGALYIDHVRNYNLLSGYPKEEYKIDICNPCFTGDMRLLTEDGYRSLEELENQTFNIVSNNGSISQGKVWCSGIKETVRLKLSNGKEIKCTPNHVFMDTNKQEVEAKDLKGKRIMPYLSSVNRDYCFEFEKFGFIQGDGQLTRLDSHYHTGLEVNIGKNDSDIFDLFGCTESDLLNNGRTIYVSGYNGFLREHGFSAKVLPERVMPTTYYQWSIKEQIGFIRGCYSANGSVLSCGRVTYKTTCKQFAEELMMALAELEISSYITTNKSKDVKFDNGTYTCKESYDINISEYDSKVKFYNTIGFAQKYKDEKLFTGLISSAPIVRLITSIGDQKVFDFTEPNNHWGVIEGIVAHNCAEYTGSAYNACNLGSINLYNMVNQPFTTDATFNIVKFKSAVRLGVKALDEILDYGLDNQPLPENKQAVLDYRAIGLGVFALGDMLVAMGIRYGSQRSLELVDSIMEVMLRTALETSCELAKTKGTFGKYQWEYIKESLLIEQYKDSELYWDIQEFGLRNGSLLSVAPTGSIATMIGLSGGVEPLYAISYDRTTHSLEKEKKNFRVFAKSVDHLLKNKGIDFDDLNEEYIVTSHEINPINRVKLQATMQKYVDNAISSTVNLNNSATVDDVLNTYITAWNLGCKGLTVFRDGCARTSILGKTEEKTVNYHKLDTIVPIKRNTLKQIQGSTIAGHTACAKNLYTTVNHKDGDIFEVFTAVSQGCKSNISTITRLASLALRSGVKVSDVVHELKANACPACVVLKQQGKKEISNSCGTCIGEAIEVAYKQLKNTDAIQKETQGLLACPQCKEPTLRPEGKCFNCSACGYSKCE